MWVLIQHFILHEALSTDRQTSVDFLKFLHNSDVLIFKNCCSSILMMQVLHHLYYFVLKARQDEGCESSLHSELDLCPF